MSLRELAAEERISAPALSGHVDRLEKADLLARVRDESDRRRVGPGSDRRGRTAAATRPRPPHDLARRPPPRSRRRRVGGGRGRDRAARKASVTAALLALNARTFASLRRHRNYRLFFTGQVISVSGTWMQNIALAWLVVELTHSPAGRRRARVLPFPPVHDLRPGRRCRRRPDRQPQARDHDAERLDDLLGDPRGCSSSPARRRCGSCTCSQFSPVRLSSSTPQAAMRSPSRWSDAKSCRTLSP